MLDTLFNQYAKDSISSSMMESSKSIVQHMHEGLLTLCMRLAVFFVLCAGSQHLYAQVDTDAPDALSTEEESSELIDELSVFEAHPLQLRTAPKHALGRVPGIELEVLMRLQRLARQAPHLKLDALCDSLVLSDEQRYIVMKSLRLDGDEELIDSDFLSLRLRRVSQLQLQSAYTDSTYQGSPIQYEEKLQWSRADFSSSVVVRKDPGETRLDDFRSGHVQYGSRPTSSLLLGDFGIQAGLGAIYSAGLMSSKGSISTPASLAARGIVGYRSSTDSRFFRGLAAAQDYVMSDETTLRALGFLSQVSRSASIDSSSGFVTSVDPSGYHRSATEIARRDALIERATGATLNIEARRFQVGGSLLMLNYNHPLLSSNTGLIVGSRASLYSIFGAYSIDSCSVVAVEHARHKNSAGCSYVTYSRRQSRQTFSLRARYIDASFRSPYGHNFGEYSQPANEMGCYAGLAVGLGARVQLGLYADLYATHSVRSLQVAPSRGCDLHTELRHNFGSSATLQCRISQTEKSDTHATDSSVKHEIMQRKRSARIAWTQKLNQTLQLGLQANAVWYKEQESPEQRGQAAMLHCQWYASDKLDLRFHYAMFSTSSFASAVYGSESGIPGVLQSVLMYGEGSHYAVVCSYDAWDHLRCAISYSSMIRNNVSSLGSGPSFTNEPELQRFSFQTELHY